MPSRRSAGSDSRMMAPPTVVFDLDGTLVDSAPDLIATLNIIFARTGLPPVAEAKASTGESCRTPCQLTVQPGGELSVTLALLSLIHI